jgi:hypothetical protein
LCCLQFLSLGVDLLDAAMHEHRFFSKLREETLSNERLDVATEDYIKFLVSIKVRSHIRLAVPWSMF